MWGYDRAEEQELLPFKNADQHFNLFCTVLERGFALHTGHTQRLIVDFKLADAGSRRYLPRVDTRVGVTFLIPENCLKPSRLYLHYDPHSESDLPELAYYDTDRNGFIAYDYSHSMLFDKQVHEPLELPVVKLSTLRGLHYIKDIACLQMFELDFDRLFAADPALAEQVREMLTRKLSRFVEFTQPWLQAEHAEQVARQYLSTHEKKKLLRRPGSLKAGVEVDDPEDSNESDTPPKKPFLTWD